jgi:membrane protein insertase Oxa1/YidC/SpoIIIJ
MTLLNNEKILSASDNQEVVLTNFRINKEVKSFFSSSYQTIFLEHISTIEKGNKRVSNFIKWAFYSAFTAFVFLVLQNIVIIENEIILEFGLFISFLSFILNLIFFFLSKRRFILIESNGGSAIEINVRGMQDKNIEDFMTKILEAKSQRFNELKK